MPAMGGEAGRWPPGFSLGLPIVEGEARRFLARRGQALPYDDLRGFGVEGLLQAALRFDPGRGIPFEAFARIRVRGAMLDALRREQSLTRVREGTGPGGRVARGGAGARRTLDGEEASVRREARFRAAVASGLLPECALSDDGGWTALSPERDPEQSLLLAERRRTLARAVAALPEDEAQLVARHVMQEEPLVEVARELGLEASAAVRRLRRALLRLATELRGAAAVP
jgi:RNA polymerase sigma factor for flagellar operon FliA